MRRVDKIFTIQPRSCADDLRRSMKSEVTVCWTTDGAFFVSSLAIGVDPRTAFLSCTYDGVPAVSCGSCVLVPFDWALNERPDLEELLHKLKEVAESVAEMHPKALPQGHCVYAISDGVGHCKLGKASDVSKRLKALQTGNAKRLYVVACLMCIDEAEAGMAETAAHRIACDYKASGEWFQVSERHAEQILYEAAAAVGMSAEVVQVEFKDEALASGGI